MSHKVYSMLELVSQGLPHNGFYVLDPRGVPPSEIEAFLRDGLRNFRSRVKSQSVMVRSGLAGQPEVKLYIAPNLDATNDELILSKLKEGLSFFSKRFNGYSNCFLILQEWTPESDYRFSLNLMSLNEEVVVEAVRGNHYLLDRREQSPTILKLKPAGLSVLQNELSASDLLSLKRQLRQVLNQFLFTDNYVYEFSLLKDRPSFYQVKKPGELYKNPISKDEFYQKLRSNNIHFKNRILRVSK